VIPFPHLWKTDPATGLLRCYRFKPDGDSPVLAEAIALRLRKAAQYAAAADVMVGAAQMRLHGYGRVEADGAALALSILAERAREYLDAVASAELGFGQIAAKWEGGAPADYRAAKAASRERFKRQFPHADLGALDD